MDVLNSKIFKALSASAKESYLYAHDLQNDKTIWSTNAVQFFGLPSEPAKNMTKKWLRRVHPDERDAVKMVQQATIDGGATFMRQQYRVMNRFGDYVWVEERGVFLRDEDGSTFLIGTVSRLDGQNMFDYLTKLYSIYEFFDRELDPRGGVLIMLGIDNYRRIVEVNGYSFGNFVLRNVADYLSQHATSDAILYRFMDDCFLLDLKGMTKSQGQDFYKRLKLSGLELTHPDGRSLHVDCSAAAVIYPDDGRVKDELVSKLENALSRGRNLKRGGLSFHSAELTALNKRRSFLREELTKSIKENFRGFELHFQPIVQPLTRKTLCCESLLRWHYINDDGEQVSVPPMEFIPILEESGEINEIGKFVAEQAMRTSKDWNERFGPIRVGFNASYKQFQVPGFVDFVLACARRYFIQPNTVVIELTESCKIDDISSIGSDFRLLEKEGFFVSLDDFGMEYSTMDLLRTMIRVDIPIDSVKIDHTFVRELAQDGNVVDKSILESIIFLTRKLDISIVVEGIETEAIEEMVTDMGVDYLQGYLYSKPLPKNVFEERLAKERGIEL